MILPDDLYDYLDDRSHSRAASRSHHDNHLGERDIVVVDDWPDRVPVTEAEIDVFERYFGNVLDEIFGTSSS